jgi:hypothetical protein
VRHPETKELYVNFDPQILTLIRETECMARLGLDIPAMARGLRAKQAHFKDNYNALNVSTLTLCSTLASVYREWLPPSRDRSMEALWNLFHDLP